MHFSMTPLSTRALASLISTREPIYRPRQSQLRLTVLLAFTFGRKFTERITSMIFSFVSSDMPLSLLIARETVDLDTPAIFAMSTIVNLPDAIVHLSSLSH